MAEEGGDAAEPREAVLDRDGKQRRTADGSNRDGKRARGDVCLRGTHANAPSLGHAKEREPCVQSHN